MIICLIKADDVLDTQRRILQIVHIYILGRLLLILFILLIIYWYLWILNFVRIMQFCLILLINGRIINLFCISTLYLI